MHKFIQLHQFYRNPSDDQEATIETMVSIADLRTFYPRRLNDAEPGTRLTFVNGNGFAVRETAEEVNRLAADAGFNFIPVTIITTSDEDEFGGEHVEGDVPAAIAAEHVRSYNPRKNGQPGTRVTFRDGGGFAIREAYEDFHAQVSPLSN